MQVIRNLTGTILIAGLGAFAYAAVPPTAAPISGSAAYAQQQQDQTPPKQDESKPKKDEARPPKAQAEAKDRTAPAKAQPRDEKQQPARDDRNASRPMQAQKGGGQHGRISDNDYHAHFGQQHSFTVRRVITTTRIVPNQTRFVYGGYTFVFVEAWPVGWAVTDDCYIDYIDGEYVLIDVAHPGVQITLNIVG